MELTLSQDLSTCLDKEISKAALSWLLNAYDYAIVEEQVSSTVIEIYVPGEVWNSMDEFNFIRLVEALVNAKTKRFASRKLIDSLLADL